MADDSNARPDSVMQGCTPGPWHVVPYGDGDSLVICSDEGGEWRICFMATHGGTESVWRAIQANAALIAAAPDMLAILEEAAAFLQALSEADLDEGAADAVTVGMVCQQQAGNVYLPRIRAAISRARGES